MVVSRYQREAKNDHKKTLANVGGIKREMPGSGDDAKEVASLSRRERKLAVRELLAAWDLARLLEWASTDGRVVDALTTLLFEPDELIRWRAIDALGNVAAILADRDIVDVRDMLRRLLWSMNDESGAAGWHSPEAIGSILAHVPELIDEFGPILASNLHEEPFERGVHWGVAGLARLRPDVFSDYSGELTDSLGTADPHLWVLAVDALAALGAESAIPAIVRLSTDETVVTIYDAENGKLGEVTVADMAKLALASIL